MENQKLQSSLENCLKQLGFKAQVLRQCDQRKVTFSALFDSKGAEVSAGSGNGDFSKEKSWAECIEHSFFLNSISSFQETPVGDILQQAGFSKDGVLKTLTKDENLTTTSFELLGRPGSKAQIPLDYVSRQSSPNSKSILKKFCSSSGYSFHQSDNEAYLHGLLEVTERHEFSNALLGRQKVYSINKSSLPMNLQNEIVYLESHFQGEIYVFTVEPQFGAWTTFVIFYPKTNRFPIPQTSQKARIDLLSSMTGALSEMRQILFLYSEEEQGEDLFVLGMPHLKAHHCIHLETFRNFTKTDISGLFSSQKVRSLEEDLDHLIQSILSQGYQPFGRTVFQFENKCHVVQVFVPGFEKYNLIRLGIEVPTHRKE